MNVRKQTENLGLFLFCGVSEKGKKATLFAIIGGVKAFCLDVFKTFQNAVWLAAAGFFCLMFVLLILVVREGRKHEPIVLRKGKSRKRHETRSGLPTRLHFYRDGVLYCFFSISLLVIVGVCQVSFGTSPSGPKSDFHKEQGSFFATVFPELRALRGEVSIIQTNQTLVLKKLEEVKKESSADPRKELANIGIQWTTQAFIDALMTGDARAVKLFLEGGMSATTQHNGASAVVYILQPTLPNPIPMLKLLLAAGFDPNEILIDTRVMANQSSIFPPHFEAQDLPKEYAAWKRVFAGPILLWVVIRSSGAGGTESDISVIEFLIERGANVKLPLDFLHAIQPAWGETESFKEIHSLVHQESQSTQPALGK